MKNRNYINGKNKFQPMLYACLPSMQLNITMKNLNYCMRYRSCSARTGEQPEYTCRDVDLSIELS